LDSETVAAALADVEGAPGGGSGVTDDDDHRHLSRPAMAGTGSAAAAAAGGGGVGSVSDAMVRRSLAGLRELCQTQELGYDFQFYPMKFKTDHPVLLCSQRRSSSSSSGGGSSQQQQQQSLVDPNACALPIVFNPSAASAASAVDVSDLVETRHYLATVAACPPAPFAPGLDKIAEEDFVRLRQSGQPSGGTAAAAGEEGGGGSGVKEDVSAADFHRWLTLARLICASCGETMVQVVHWQRALALEAARVARLPPRLQPAAAAASNTTAFAGMAGGETFASPATVRTHTTNAMGPPPPPLGAPKQVNGGVANGSPSSSSAGARWALPVHMEGEEE
jgi:hypothetical protein